MSDLHETILEIARANNARSVELSFDTELSRLRSRLSVLQTAVAELRAENEQLRLRINQLQYPGYDNG